MARRNTSPPLSDTEFVFSHHLVIRYLYEFVQQNSEILRQPKAPYNNVGGLTRCNTSPPPKFLDIEFVFPI